MTAQTGELAVEPVSARPWFLNIDAIGAAAPVVVLIVVGTLRKGAFFKPDVIVLPCLCLALALTSPAVLRWLRVHVVALAAGVLATAWWLVDAAVWKHDVESWRMPATWICAAAGYGVVRALPAVARRVVALAATIIGFAVSVVGLGLVAARSATWTWADERSLRLQGPLTYPSAIGLYLLVTLLASMEVWRRESGRTAELASAVRAVIMLGVVATDSRGALVGLLVLVCFRSVRAELGPAIFAAVVAAPVLLYGQRDGVRSLLIAAAGVIAIAVVLVPNTLWRRGIRLIAIPALVAAGWLLATQHHAVSGLDASWTERGHILRGALTVFGGHPLLGAGPDPWIPTKTLTGLPGIDAFAHNEPLELLISVGLVGTAVIVAAAAVVVRHLRLHRRTIVGPLATAVLAAGLVDFVWHFAALGLLCGAAAATVTLDRR